MLNQHIQHPLYSEEMSYEGLLNGMGFFAFTEKCSLSKKQSSRKADTGFYMQKREHVFHMDVMNTFVITNNRHNCFPTIMEDSKCRTVITKIN